MEQYIKKSALMAELNRLIVELLEEGEDTMFEQGRISAFEDVKVFINHTLEVNEVDLEKEATEFVQTKEFVESKESPVLLIAKYFFELGLKAQKGE